MGDNGQHPGGVREQFVAFFSDTPRAETVYTMNAMYNGGGGGNSSAAAGLSADSGGVGGNGGGDGGGSQSIPEIKIEASLPDAWEALESGDGQTYYHHKSSGQTQWTKPHP